MALMKAMLDLPVAYLKSESDMGLEKVLFIRRLMMRPILVKCTIFLRTVLTILVGIIIWLMIFADDEVSARRRGKAELLEQYGIEQTERLLMSRVLARKDITTVFPAVFFSRVSEEGARAIRLTKVEHGVATLSADSQWVTFVPDKGYSGSAAIWFVSSEDKREAQEHNLTLIVTDAPLVNLHFVQLPVRLDLTTPMQLYVVGESANGQQGLLPPSAVLFESSNPMVASVSATGQMTGLAEGVGVVIATTQRLQAVTAFAVGVPKNTDQNGQLLYAFGLEVVPNGLAMLAQEGRQQLTTSLRVRPVYVADLTGAHKGTVYYVSDPKVVSVSKDGFLIARQEGVATITVVNGPASAVVPVHVHRSRPAPVVLDDSGGIIRGADGALISVLPHTLQSARRVDIVPISTSKLLLPIPKPFEIVTAFRLEIGPGRLAQDIQIALPGLVRDKHNRTVLFLRQTSLPNKDGVEISLWMQEARGVIGPDNMIHTDASRSSGIRFEGTYAVVMADPDQVGTVQGHVSYFFPTNPASTFAIVAVAGKESAIGGWVGRERDFGLILGLGVAALKAVEVTPEGLTVEADTSITVQNAGRELSGGESGGKEFSIQLINQYYSSENKEGPGGRPEIKKARLVKPESGAELILEGDRFVFANERAPAAKREGASPLDLTVNFHMPGRNLPYTCNPLIGSTNDRLRVKIPSGVILGLVKVSVARPQWQRTASGWDRQLQVVSREEDLEGDPHYHFVPDGESRVAVFDLISHKFVKYIQVGRTSSPSRPRGVIIPTADSGPEQRAYIALEKEQRVAVIDTELLEEVDLIPETPAIDGLPFEDGEPSTMVWCCPGQRGERLYISDRKKGRIAVYDISPQSETFHQRLAWITVGPAPVGLREMAVVGSRNRLYVLAPASVGAGGDRTAAHVLVVDIDANSPTYHQQIGQIAVDGDPVAIDAWIHGTGPTIFTTQAVDGPAIGVIQDEDGGLGWKVSYIRFGQSLGINEGRVVVSTGVKVVPAGKGGEQTKGYAIVTYSSAILPPESGKARSPSDDDIAIARTSGSTRVGGIGLIEDPSGANPRFMKITKTERDSYPFLTSDGFDEIYELDHQKRVVNQLDLLELTQTMRGVLVPPSGSIPLLDINPKIMAYSFYTGFVPHGIAPAGALKVQLWVE